MAVIGAWLDRFQPVAREQDIGNTAFIHRQAADIGLAHLGHQRPVGVDIVLDADGEISASSRIFSAEAAGDEPLRAQIARSHEYLAHRANSAISPRYIKPA